MLDRFDELDELGAVPELVARIEGQRLELKRLGTELVRVWRKVAMQERDRYKAALERVSSGDLPDCLTAEGKPASWEDQVLSYVDGVLAGGQP